MTIKTLFIANRGEIAVRVILAAKALGIRTVQAASEADTDMLAARMADQVVVLGGAPAAQSYLNIPAVLDAIRSSGADAVHPGYGFLSENADFVEQVERMGVTFVGPTAETIRKMGDKSAARAEAIAAGVPVVPGSTGDVADAQEAQAVAREIGYPVMIKARAGGGGRGIRISGSADELSSLIPQAKAEARAAFGDDALYLERYIPRARHVEVQVLGDGERVVHLFERECSLQRKRQKVWEEAPAAALPPATREALCESAVALATRVGYRGAGTLEYLYDEGTGAFFFIEMNTRIQVEHPVTEMITGIDLVQAQLRIAGGEKLWLSQRDIQAKGHAIEVRINAENPDRMFMPSPGTVSALTVPHEDVARFDTMLFAGYKVVPFYDSLIGKLIVYGRDRADALVRLEAALDGLQIEGIATTRSLHKALLGAPDVRAGNVHTTWLEDWMKDRASDPK
ncbi:acetyl-CoA carboxylase biotin carboxylase subunit [Rhodoligotrophos ferricapiens]|uniref:acetyl-CoA carboxylase biotin carboxylase subunit n=1 Tax=Rhodoligotrophos ferricapiens TaxID=3069264 RepID=UPI00315C84BF